RRTLAAAGVAGPATAARHHGLAARVRHPTDRPWRAAGGETGGPPGGRVRPGARHLVLDRELPHPVGGRPAGRAVPAVPVLRPDRHPAGVRSALVGQAAGPAAGRLTTPDTLSIVR